MGRIAVTSSERVRYFVAKLLPWLVISEILLLLLLLHAVSSTSVVLSDWSILSQVEALCVWSIQVQVGELRPRCSFHALISW